MSSRPEPLREERLRDLLGDDPAVATLVVLEHVDSTNEVVRRLATEGAPAGTVVVAEQQTAGRGRLGRRWHSPPRLGLYVSILYRPRRPARELTRWTLAAAVAACEACRSAGAQAASIKWPNDLTWNGLKLGGVLAEMRTSGEVVSELVVGAGINVLHSAEDFPAELAGRATSLRLATGGDGVDREALAASYLIGLGRLARLLDHSEWTPVAGRWEQLATGARGQRVRVHPGGDSARDTWEGVTGGLDEGGGLRVRREDGSLEIVHLADSIRFAEPGPRGSGTSAEPMLP